MVNSTDHFAIKVVEFFEKNPTHIINVLVGIDATRRKVYEAIVSELEKIYSGDEISIETFSPIADKHAPSLSGFRMYGDNQAYAMYRCPRFGSR